jgi:ribosomal subunit interface protein
MVNITYKYNDLEEAKSLTGLVESKLNVLQKFTSPDSSVLCEVEFEKVAAQQTGQIFRFEVNATIDGKLYRADAVEDSFEKAIDEVRNELDKELRRAKDKNNSVLRRAARKLKGSLFRS